MTLTVCALMKHHYINTCRKPSHKIKSCLYLMQCTANQRYENSIHSKLTMCLQMPLNNSKQRFYIKLKSGERESDRMTVKVHKQYYRSST